MIVWFKKDLRIQDHAPLVEASRTGCVIPVYVYEPEVIAAEDFSPRHLEFINSSLKELHQKLTELGSGLLILKGSIPEVFEKLKEEIPFAGIHSHEETGNGITYNRDLRMASWCEKKALTGKSILKPV